MPVCMHIYANIYTHTYTYTIGSEWFSFPSHFFLPKNTHIAFYKDGFTGMYGMNMYKYIYIYIFSLYII